MRREAFIVIALLSSTFAGCLSAEVPAEPAALDVPLPPALAGLAYICPPNGVERGGVCVSSLATRTESLQEPFLAVDPYRPGVMAIGVNAGHTVGAVNLARPTPGLDMVLLDIYVTEDAGATWRLSQIPYVNGPGFGPVEAGGSGDPALAFDENGVLHVSGIISQSVLVRGFGVFYTSSPDLGKTWTTPVTFTTDDDNDRNWITVAPGGAVYVPWQNVGESSEVAWSLDGGATWKISEAAPKCITVSPVVVRADGTPIFACAGLGSRNLDGIEVHALDTESGAVTKLAEASSGVHVWPMVRALPDGTLALAYESYASGSTGPELTLSHDGGMTWTAPTLIAAGLDGGDAWSGGATLYWFDADPWGGLHFLVMGAARSSPVPLVTSTTYQLVHAVFASDGATVISQQRLPAMGARDPPSVAPEWGDHYYGIGFADTMGYAVWTRDKGLDIAAFELILEELPLAEVVEGAAETP